MKALILLFLATLSGCSFHHAPEENSEFSVISDFSALEGTYLNKGETGYSYSRYLSSVIWKNNEFNTNRKKPIKSKEIELIDVTSNNNKLIVKAIINNCVVHESIYIKGKDINIKNGRLVTNNELSMVSSVHVGPSYSKEVIGIDEKGHGKLMRNEYAAGLIYMIMPFSLTSTDEIRFKKVENEKQYRTCKNR